MSDARERTAYDVARHWKAKYERAEQKAARYREALRKVQATAEGTKTGLISATYVAAMAADALAFASLETDESQVDRGGHDV